MSSRKYHTSYNPETAPDPTDWLSTREDQRLRQVVTFHMVYRERNGNQKAHAALHLAVENQIAMGFGPTVRAMHRLQSEGLSRHDTIHAISSVLAEHIYNTAQATTQLDSATRQRAINLDIEELTAARWRAKYGSAKGDA